MTRPLALGALALGALALAAALGPAAALAQPVQQKLTAADGSGGDWFGYSVSVSGDVAVVGAYGDDDNGMGSGSAYVFRFDGASWVEEQKLTAADGSADDWSGYSVSVSGDVAIVGAAWDDDDGPGSGSAYVFRYDGASWVEEQKLTAADGGAYQAFGFSVSVSGDVTVVGALNDDDDGPGSGSAYVFRFDDSAWVEEQKLTASDGNANDLFGFSVSGSGDIAVVGAPWDDDGLDDSGSAYVFRFDGASWVEEQKLTAADGSAYDLFGISVSVSGDVAVVGAPWDADRSGSAYVYRFDDSAWVEEQKLTAADASTFAEFGSSVSVTGDVALVGARGGDGNVPGSGSAYVYRRAGSAWVPAQKLTAADGSAGDQFGGSVSVSGDVAVVGAYWSDDNGNDSGSAYVFSRSTSVATEPEAAPVSLIVHPPVPNPTAERAAVAFALAEAAEVRLALHDVLGREVAVVNAGRLAAGTHQLPLDVSSLPAGVYVWRLAAGERVEAGRLTVAR